MAGTRLFELKKGDKFTDVTFDVQGSHIRAHRLVVISAGGGLSDLLEQNPGGRVEIKEGVAPETFKSVLKYIYTDTCDVNDENLFQMTHAAKVFGLEQLERHCAEVVKRKLATSNVVAFASHAVELGAKENVKVCQEYFRTNTLQIIKTKEFLEISHDVLLTLCSSDGIACSELDLFIACVEWAKRECRRKRWEVTPENQRSALGVVLGKIRFPVMKKEEFEDKVVPLEILTYEEVGRLVVGWRKKEKRTDFSDELRTEVMKVYVTDHRKCKYPNTPDSELTLPLSTSIKDLKEMKIFDNCLRQFPPDKFTLAHKGNILRNEDTLASIYTDCSPGEELVIDIHSFDIRVGEYDPSKYPWEFPLTVKTSDLSNIDRIILGAVYSQKGITPDQAWIKYAIGEKVYQSVDLNHLFPGHSMFVETESFSM